MTDKEKPPTETWKWKNDTSPLSNCRINVLQTPLSKHCPLVASIILKAVGCQGSFEWLWNVESVVHVAHTCTALFAMVKSKSVFTYHHHASLQWMNHTVSQPASHHTCRVWCRPVHVRTLGQYSGFLLWISLREHRWIQHAHTIQPFCTCMNCTG